MRTCLAFLVDECGELGFELLGDFRFELGDFPGGVEASLEDFRDLKDVDEVGVDLNNLAGGALLGEEEGLRKRAGTFLFLFPRSKSDKTAGSKLLWPGLDSLTTWTSLSCELVTCLLRVSTFEVA